MDELIVECKTREEDVPLMKGSLCGGSVGAAIADFPFGSTCSIIVL